MVVDQDHPAVPSSDPQRLLQGRPADVFRLLVEQEEEHRVVEDAVLELQPGRVLAVQPHPRAAVQLAAGVLQLNVGHVDQVQGGRGRQAVREAGREVTVDAGHLQGASLDLFPQFGEGRVAKTAEVAPQDQVDQPLAFEEAHGGRVQVGPPVGAPQVTRDVSLFFGGRGEGGRPGGAQARFVHELQDPGLPRGVGSGRDYNPSRGGITAPRQRGFPCGRRPGRSPATARLP